MFGLSWAYHSVRAIIGGIVGLIFAWPLLARLLGVTENSIHDRRFRAQLGKVRRMAEFLLEEGVALRSGDEPLRLGTLEVLSYHPYGRSPSSTEWDRVADVATALASCQTDALKRKFRHHQLHVFFRILPIVFLTVAVASLIGAFSTLPQFVDNAELVAFRTKLATIKAPVQVPSNLPAKPVTDAAGPSEAAPADQSSDGLGYFSNDPTTSFLVTMTWALSLGGLGACAYLGTALIRESTVWHGGPAPASRVVAEPEAEDDPNAPRNGESPEEIDLTDSNLLVTRIVVGILFAFLLGLPFAYTSLKTILTTIADPSKFDAVADPKHLAYMVIPFVLGFSTTLVLGILERLIGAVRTLFGLSGNR